MYITGVWWLNEEIKAKEDVAFIVDSNAKQMLDIYFQENIIDKFLINVFIIIFILGLN
ncbi:hypothetical protein [Clostridium thermarum]|uniref:hypothetical protein n=1 Tax=Clostridium thermarum TaxID=1716543 RepID=UPI0013D56AA2|nr:hypothetical protein [Clostridium thermarum]